MFNLYPHWGLLRVCGFGIPEFQLAKEEKKIKQVTYLKEVLRNQNTKQISGMGYPALGASAG